MRLQIVAARRDDEAGFREQVAMIKATGAEFETARRVWWHDSDRITAEQLTALFEVVRTYGAHVMALT